MNLHINLLMNPLGVPELTCVRQELEPLSSKPSSLRQEVGLHRLVSRHVSEFTCVGQKLKPKPHSLQEVGLPRFAGRKRKRELATKRSVHFSDNVSESKPIKDSQIGDSKDLWWSPSEIQQFQVQARMELRMLMKQRPRFPEYFENFETMFQDCIRHSSIEEVMRAPSSSRTLESCMKAPFNGTLRGLENRLVPSLSRYRKFHTRSLLIAQKNLILYGEEHRRESILSAHSLNTSRASQSLARIMGHADSKQVLRMLQRELTSLEKQDAY
jgi:hypothetical protein